MWYSRNMYSRAEDYTQGRNRYHLVLHLCRHNIFYSRTNGEKIDTTTLCHVTSVTATRSSNKSWYLITAVVYLLWGGRVQAAWICPYSPTTVGRCFKGWKGLIVHTLGRIRHLKPLEHLPSFPHIQRPTTGSPCVPPRKWRKHAFFPIWKFGTQRIPKMSCFHAGTCVTLCLHIRNHCWPVPHMAVWVTVGLSVENGKSPVTCVFTPGPMLTHAFLRGMAWWGSQRGTTQELEKFPTLPCQDPHWPMHPGQHWSWHGSMGCWEFPGSCAALHQDLCLPIPPVPQ